jgi:hypothetical protein
MAIYYYGYDNKGQELIVTVNYYGTSKCKGGVYYFIILSIEYYNMAIEYLCLVSSI